MILALAAIPTLGWAQMAGQADPSFGASLGLAGSVIGVLPVSGGKMLVFGNFSRGILRLNADGSLDASFNPGSGSTNYSSSVHSAVVQSDGKVVIGGIFDSFNGATHHGIARLMSDGSLDASFTAATGQAETVDAVALQTDGKIVIAGNFATIDGTSSGGIARLASDGSLDATFNPGVGADGEVFALSIQSDGGILIGGGFANISGVARHGIARLASDGSLDDSFDPGEGANGTVKAIALQTDGRLLIAGSFTTVNGTSRGNMARLLADGSLDPTFTVTGATNYSLNTIAVQSDGNILVGGAFNTIDGATRHNVARLMADGSLDASFDPGTGTDFYVNTVVVDGSGGIFICGVFTSYNGVSRGGIAKLLTDGTLDTTFQADVAPGLNQFVDAIAVQPDGKVVVAGAFTTLNGASLHEVARFREDGSLDPDFNGGTGANNYVEAVAVQPDGQIIFGGAFTTFNGVNVGGIVRVAANGATDPGFNAGSGIDRAGFISAVALQTDGKIVMVGTFTTVNGTSRRGIARLNSDGSLDASFNPGTAANGAVYTLVIQADGKIVVGGNFSVFNGSPAYLLARLNPDGTLDQTYAPGFGSDGSEVDGIALQADGKVVVGGIFTTVNGVSRNSVARFLTNGSLDTGFNPGGGADGFVAAVTTLADGSIVLGGGFDSFNGVSRNALVRLNPDGSLLTSYDAGAGDGSQIFALAAQGNASVLVGGEFTDFGGVVRNYLARVDTTGALDPAFVPGGGTVTINAIGLQTDGQLVIGGDFSSVNGVANNALARLTADGNPDNTFVSGYALGDTVQAVALQDDDDLIAAATVTSTSPAGMQLTNSHRSGLLPGPRTQSKITNPIHRCSHPTGAFDPNFFAYTDGTTTQVVPLAGNLVLLGGTFTQVDGQNHANLARVTATGALDPSFVGVAGNTVNGIALQSDGKIMVAGDFTTVDGVARGRVARLNANGSLDTTFNPGTGPNGSVKSVKVLSNGEVSIAGSFTTVNGTARRGVALLYANGTLDDGFVLGTSSAVRRQLRALGLPVTAADDASSVLVNSLEVQPDDKMVIGGLFTQIGGSARNNVARLLPDGSVDTTFDSGSGPDAAVNVLRLQSDGRTLLGGSFTSVEGLQRTGAARLFGDASTATAVPVISGNLAPACTQGTGFSYQITASNSPTTYDAVGLPAGLTVSKASGKIAGTPTALGTFRVSLLASNAGGTGSAIMNLAVKPAPPKITSALTATGKVGTAFTYQISASNSPTSYGESGLHSGLSINQTTGAISGRPTAAGTYSVTIAAFNAGGSGTAQLTLTIVSPSPVITSATAATATGGVSFKYQIAASNNPASYGASGLPSGLTINQSTGLISGAVKTAGTYTVTIAAFNNGGSGAAKLTLRVKVAPPVITSALTESAQVGVAFTYQVTATNSPTKYAISSLPAGLTFDTATGKLSGTPTKAGSYRPLVSATNAGGTGSANVALTVKPAKPVITSSLNPPARQGVAFSYQITATNGPTTYATSSVPPGLSFSTSTGKFTGTPTKAGTYKPLVSAINSGGSGSVNLDLVVKPPE